MRATRHQKQNRHSIEETRQAGRGGNSRQPRWRRARTTSGRSAAAAAVPAGDRLAAVSHSAAMPRPYTPHVSGCTWFQLHTHTTTGENRWCHQQRQQPPAPFQVELAISSTQTGSPTAPPRTQCTQSTDTRAQGRASHLHCTSGRPCIDSGITTSTARRCRSTPQSFPASTSAARPRHRGNVVQSQRYVRARGHSEHDTSARPVSRQVTGPTQRHSHTEHQDKHISTAQHQARVSPAVTCTPRTKRTAWQGDRLHARARTGAAGSAGTCRLLKSTVGSCSLHLPVHVRHVRQRHVWALCAHDGAEIVERQRRRRQQRRQLRRWRHER